MNRSRLSPAVGVALVVAGILSTVYAWQNRHPLTSADFPLFYHSAERTDASMYDAPPGVPRNNMNPPQFQLLMRPLTLLPLPAASALFRAAGFVCLLACVWWIARTSTDQWSWSDVGALLAWTPMAAMISLNQVSWILWPLLLYACFAWRKARWTSGAIAYGLVLGLKPFVGVIVVALALRRQYRAAIVAVATAAASLAASVVAYGAGPFRAWTSAVGGVQWWSMGLNASLMGSLSRIAAGSNVVYPTLPASIRWLGTAGAAVLVVFTIVRTRRWPIDRAWTPLMAAALMASPLGWVYYAWWLLPGPLPSRLLIAAPTLWVPFAFVTFPPGHGAAFGHLWALTIGSAYFWGLFAAWLIALRDGAVAAEPSAVPS